MQVSHLQIREVPVVAKLSTELICFDPKVSICNGEKTWNSRENLYLYKRETLSFSQHSHRSVSVTDIFLLAARICICNWNEIALRKDV